MEARTRPIFNKPDFCPCTDVLSGLSDPKMIRIDRLNHAGMPFVTNVVRGALEIPTGRSAAMTAEVKVINTICYLAAGEMA